ncbi:MAG: bifunctional phosphopantothenoylcysteine decarboxylase/phosphopantothenate synthase, partial [Alphaproteobacteria bacterium]|nr:bifunctional phosphopantothenoylcysteine decarboxylase/phosphopantothenate synthase [Alphaproteobacteria bacterium]
MTQASLTGRKILLIVGGGIAAYKALALVRLLKKAGAEVMSLLTPAGAEFVTPMSLAALTGRPVRQALFMPEDETAMGHIELSRWADLVVVAPATAGLIAKAANGMADDLASTTLLATDKRVLLAPAMNVRMWLHPAVQANVERL